jgi:hypothetical protein
MSGGLVYEHVSGAVAHLHYDNGDVRVVAFDLVADQHCLPDRNALEHTALADLSVWRDSEDRLQELRKAGVPDDDSRVVATRNNRVLLLVSDLGDHATFPDHRGRPPEWPPERYMALARGFVEIGNSWSELHENWAREKHNLGERAVRKRMEQAVDLGILRVAKRGGANAYELTGLELRDQAGREEWHRRNWRAATTRRNALQAAFDSGRATLGPS